MRVAIYNSRVRWISYHGKYKLLKNALKNAKATKQFYSDNKATWMHVWIAE